MSSEGMQTSCPSCHTVFAVSDEDLGLAGGRVRCGDCLSVFDALANQHIDEASAIASTPPPPPMDAVLDTPEDSGAIDTPDTNMWLDAGESGEDAFETPPDSPTDAAFESTSDPSPEAPSELALETLAESEASSEDSPEASSDIPTEMPLEVISEGVSDVDAGTIRYDDSGMFRFSDDTPQEILDEELKALVGDTTEDDAPEPPAPTDSELFSSDNAEALLHFGSTQAGDDWNDLLLEVGENASDANQPAPLDFELAATDSASAASLDLDLTRSGEPEDKRHKTEDNAVVDIGVAESNTHELASSLDVVFDEAQDATPDTELPDQAALESEADALFDQFAEEAAAQQSESIAEVEDEDDNNSDDHFDKDALADILSASQIFLVDDDQLNDESNTDAPAAELDTEPGSTHHPDVIAELEDINLDAESSDEYAAIAGIDEEDAASTELDAQEQPIDLPHFASALGDINLDAESSDEYAAIADKADEVSAELAPSDSSEPAAQESNGETADSQASGVSEAAELDTPESGSEMPDVATDDAASEEIVLQSKPVTPITEGQFANASAEDIFAESMILSAPQIDPRRWLWTGLSLLLIVALAIQGIHMKRSHLATVPPWSGPIISIYERIGMPITPDWDIRALCIQRSGSSLGDAVLDIETLFKNSAERSVPLPVIKVDITDNFEDVIATTIVSPKDYLPPTQASKTMLEPGRQQQANMTLAYAESRADKFELSLCYSGAGETLRCGADICGNP